MWWWQEKVGIRGLGRVRWIGDEEVEEKPRRKVEVERWTKNTELKWRSLLFRRRRA